VIVNYIVLGIALLFEGAAWYFAYREFNKVRGRRSYFEAVREGKDPSLFVVLFEDSAAMLGLLFALGGIFLSEWTGNPVFDGIASVLIGLILAGTAIWLAFETKSLLIGESAEPGVVEGIRKILGSNPNVEHVNEILTMHMGPEYILVNISVDFRDSLPVGAIEKTVGGLDIKIKSAFPRVKRVFVEAESRR
jgi:divalent metal cation (Fe/Co/Zn/Cd) transporter